jgi:hypothetical protein
MTMHRSDRFKEIAEQTEREYTKVPTESWFRSIAPKWRNRVGLPRLIAENVTIDAIGTFRSINRGIFRDPGERERYDRALEALTEFSVEFSRENWCRFEGSGS